MHTMQISEFDWDLGQVWFVTTFVKADVTDTPYETFVKILCARLRCLQSPKSRRSAISGLCSEPCTTCSAENRYTPWPCHALLQISPGCRNDNIGQKAVLQFRKKKKYCSMVGFEPTTMTTFGSWDPCSTTWATTLSDGLLSLSHYWN